MSTRVKIKLFDLLKRVQAVISNNEARRYVYHGIIYLNHQPLSGTNPDLLVKPGDILRVGKKCYTLSEENLREEM